MSTDRESSVLNWAIVGIVLLLALAVGGTYVGRRAFQARQTAQFGVIYGNLRAIEGAKEQWALEQKRKNSDVPVSADLAPFFPHNKLPTAVVGETYNLNAIGTAATATLPPHVGLGKHAAKGGTVTLP